MEPDSPRDLSEPAVLITRRRLDELEAIEARWAPRPLIRKYVDLAAPSLGPAEEEQLLKVVRERLLESLRDRQRLLAAGEAEPELQFFVRISEEVAAPNPYAP